MCEKCDELDKNREAMSHLLASGVLVATEIALGPGAKFIILCKKSGDEGVFFTGNMTHEEFKIAAKWLRERAGDLANHIQTMEAMEEAGSSSIQ